MSKYTTWDTEALEIRMNELNTELNALWAEWYKRNPLPEPEPEFWGEPYKVVATAGVNVRNEPTTSSAILNRLTWGQIVTLRPDAVNADGYLWRPLQEGGWVAEKALSGGQVFMAAV